MPQFIRFCPNCFTQLKGPDAHDRYECTNDPKSCEIIQLKYPPGRARVSEPPTRIIRASRPRLHYTTTVLYYDNILQQGGEEE